jgi:hypothetical protein
LIAKVKAAAMATILNCRALRLRGTIIATSP